MNTDSTGPADYLCRECGNPVLYAVDHKHNCRFYYNPFLAFANQSEG